MTQNRLLRDSLLAMAVAALGSAAAGCSHDPAPAQTQAAATTSGGEAAPSNASGATASNDPAHPGNDLPTATPAAAAVNAGHTGGVACGAGECS